MRIDITAREFTVTSNKHFPISSGKDSTTWVNYIDGSIHGYKFEDLNANGIQDGKEGPLQGVVFDLYKFVRTDVTEFTSGKFVTTYVWEGAGSASTGQAR